MKWDFLKLPAPKVPLIQMLALLANINMPFYMLLLQGLSGIMMFWPWYDNQEVKVGTLMFVTYQS